MVCVSRILIACTLAVWACADGAPTDVSALNDGADVAQHNAVSFSYDHDSKTGNLGEPVVHKHTASIDQNPEADLIQMGEMLAGLKSDDSTGQAIESLTGALQAKSLMDTLSPNGVGSFVQAHNDEPSLGENTEKSVSFASLMRAKKKNMAAITQYLMARKQEGRPLTAHEDQELQKFYYNRASTILKKIVLLKQGQTPPEFQPSTTAHKRLVHPEIDESEEEGADETDKLNYDATVARDNTAFDNKKAAKLERQEEANTAERQAEDKEEMDQLSFDRKIAEANEHYNDKLLSEVQMEAKRAAHVSQAAQMAANALKSGMKLSLIHISEPTRPY
eukprot:TRINITY_DN4296_c0_g2_i2.p1 TRINITY_DN4296_c0_g2~~TRINITY_DN4296_c0_g2_i2.p1  ORF type:complete len:334 (-),score=97.05 TRINITY_DN4296_c0_g2_i2:140-1141(-)